MDKNRQQSSDFYRLITETVKIYVRKSLIAFQTSLQLVGMSEIQARKSLLGLYFSRYLPARTECKTEPVLSLCTKRRILEKTLCKLGYIQFQLWSSLSLLHRRRLNKVQLPSPVCLFLQNLYPNIRFVRKFPGD